MNDFITLAIIAVLGVFIIGVIYNRCRSKKQKQSYKSKKQKQSYKSNIWNNQKTGLRYDSMSSINNNNISRFVKEGAEERIRRRMKY